MKVQPKDVDFIYNRRQGTSAFSSDVNFDVSQ